MIIVHIIKLYIIISIAVFTLVNIAYIYIHVSLTNVAYFAVPYMALYFVPPCVVFGVVPLSVALSKMPPHVAFNIILP